ncbi:MAG: FAD-dependent urate hydroxylase HpxO [Microcystaceae cyanobacterium]
MYKLKIVIIGAGIGGLTAGIALKQAGFDIEIYDRVKELRPVGAGISLWSNGVKVLNRLGLGDKMAEIGGMMDSMAYYDATGTPLNNIDLTPLFDIVGQRPYPVARADLQKMLQDELESYGVEIKLNHQCVEVKEDKQGVTAIFDNGHTAKGDLLVAADGVRSILRTYVLGEEVKPKYGGYVNWNGLVPADEALAPKNSWVIYVGNHQRASMMPVAGERFYFFFDVPLAKGTPAEPDQYPAQLKKYFEGWADPVQRLIEAIDPYKVARPEIHDVGPLNALVRGKVALIGDAGHATCPDLGQGGCQAMEDGLVLTQYLQTTNISVEDALKRYEAERKVRTSAVVQKARKRAEQIHGKDPAVTKQWYNQLANESPQDVRDAIAKVILAGPMH